MKKRTVSMDLIREMYRIENKYWKTGDVDIIEKMHNTARQIDPKYYSEISGIARIVTQEHRPVYVLADALKALGYEVVGLWR